MNISLDCLHAALREKNLLKAKDIQNSTSYETVKCILESEVCFELLSTLKFMLNIRFISR